MLKYCNQYIVEVEKTLKSTVARTAFLREAAANKLPAMHSCCNGRDYWSRKVVEGQSSLALATGAYWSLAHNTAGPPAVTVVITARGCHACRHVVEQINTLCHYHFASHACVY